MPRPLRLVALTALVALAALLSGCGDKEAAYHEAKTEGPYLKAGPLTYQIQLSRELNAKLPYDAQILHSLPPGNTPGKGEELFGIWLRVENPTDEAQLTAVNFDITDTLGNTYDPIPFVPGSNSMIYQPVSLRSGGLLPTEGTIQSQGGPRGQVIVFKIKTTAYQNRPLEFTIHPASGERARVELDL